MEQPAEFRLMVECCRRAFSAGDPCSIDIPATVDWQRFVGLVRFHRVHGLVWATLGAMTDLLPQQLVTPLSDEARAIAATNLSIARESADLHEAFERAGLPLLFVKGLTVGALAYRSPMLKVGWDIDLLIAVEDLAASADLLRSRGFSLSLPARSFDLEPWHGWSKESVWSRSDGIQIELHTRLVDHKALLPTIDVRSPRQTVAVTADVALPTLSDTELFAYLSVHGASSAWFRLKWISDLAGFLTRKTGPEVEALYEAALQLGAGRAPGQALLLADSLFGSLNDAPALRSRLQSIRTVKLLSEAALALVSGEPVEPTERRFGTWTIHWTQLLMMPGIRFASSEAWRQATNAMRAH